MKRRRSRNLPVISEQVSSLREGVRLFTEKVQPPVGRPPVVTPQPGGLDSTEMRSRFWRLFNLQHWLWGCDVRHVVGNRLIQMGLQRIPAPPGFRSPSVYLQSLPRGRTVILRGFGTVIAEAGIGAVFLSRYLPFPEWMPEFDPGVDHRRLPFVPEQLPPRVLPSPSEMVVVRDLVVQLLQWIAEWEQAAIEQLGPIDRDRSILDWSPRGTEFSAATLPAIWRQLVGRMEAAPSQSLAWFDRDAVTPVARPVVA